MIANLLTKLDLSLYPCYSTFRFSRKQEREMLQQYCFCFIVNFFAWTNPLHAQYILIDRSNSTSDEVSRIITEEIGALGSMYVEILPWNEKPGTLLSGPANKLSSLLPAASASTNLGGAFDYFDKRGVVCQTLIAIVHGKADDMIVLKNELSELIEKNRIVLLVIGTAEHLKAYAKISHHGNFRVKKLKKNDLLLFYRALVHPEGCVKQNG